MPSKRPGGASNPDGIQPQNRGKQSLARCGNQATKGNPPNCAQPAGVFNRGTPRTLASTWEAIVEMAAPRPASSAPRRIQLNIIARALRQPRPNHARLATCNARSQLPKQFVPPVAAASVSARQPLHPGDQIRPGRLDHGTKRPGLRTQARTCQRRPGARLAGKLDEALSIRRAMQDRFSSASARRGAIHRAAAAGDSIKSPWCCVAALSR